jgi:AcrR family transcriptional regulator
MTVVTNIKAPLRHRKKAAVRAKIIATAIEMFSRHGLDGVTVEQIADVADVGKGTIYNYFATKEDIVVAFMADLEANIQPRLRRFATSSGSPSSILTEFVRYHFRLKRPYHPFVRVFLGQMFVRTEQFLPYMAEMQKAIDPPLEELFQSLQARGLMHRDVQIAQLIPVFKTILLGLTALWAVEGPPFRGTEMVLKQEIKFFCEGLENRKS